MAEIVESKSIKGVYHAYLRTFTDPRGRFLETYRREWFPGGKEMVQGNRSESAANVLRGMHFHFKQADYWFIMRGRVWVSLFDARHGSPTFGQSEGFELGDSDDTRTRDHGIYIPPGVAHGFYTFTECTMTYLVEAYYDNKDEHGILWSDPAMKLAWPAKEPILSQRDLENPMFKELLPQNIPYYRD